MTNCCLNITDGSVALESPLPSDLTDPGVRTLALQQMEKGLFRIRRTGDRLFAEFTCLPKEVFPALRAWLVATNQPMNLPISFRNLKTGLAIELCAGGIVNPQARKDAFREQVNPQFLAVAKASTPGELHEAVMRFHLHSVWENPWIVSFRGPHITPRELLIRMDLPYHLEWPSWTFGNNIKMKDRMTAADIGEMDVRGPAGPVSVELIWRMAIASGYPVLRYPQGMQAPGLLIPPDASPVRSIEGSPEEISSIYAGIAAGLGYLDQFQLMAFRCLAPVAIPGFPKFYWERESSPTPGFYHKGQRAL